MKRYRLAQFTLCLLLISGCVPQHSRQDENPPREVSFVISPFLPGNKEALTLRLIAWATRQPDCRFRIYNGGDGLEVASFTAPRMEYYKEEAAIRRIGPPLQQWMSWSRSKASE